MRVPGEATAAFLERHKAERISGPSAQVAWIWMNAKVPPFQDQRVRLAFAHAFDRSVTVGLQREEGGIPATGGIIPPGLPGHTPNLALAYDPDRARALLAEAGFPGGRGFPTVELLTIGLLPTPARCEKLRAQWSSVLQVDVELVSASFEEAPARIHARPPAMARTAWLADFPDPDNFLRLGFGFYGDLDWSPRYAELVEQARCVTDVRRRIGLYQQADRLLIQEAAVIPLAYGRLDMLVRPEVRRFPLSPVRTWFWKDVVIEPS
jgi:ABC-type transport system substrate-binding protein